MSDSVCAVARRHGLLPQQVFGWRRQLRDAADSQGTEVEFVPAVIAAGTALRLCLDRILPARRDRPVTFELPPLSSAADARAASAALLAAVSEGSLTPNEAAEVGKLIDAYVKAAELTEVLARIENLEQKLWADLSMLD